MPSAGDVAFYRDQLEVLAQDTQSGTLTPADAAGSHAEIGRRLLAAADHSQPLMAVEGRRWRLLSAAVLTMLAVPAVSLGLYHRLGAPDQPDLPLAARRDAPSTNQLADAIARVESHLAAHPDDGRGYAVLAPLYLRLERFSDAAHAYERVLALLGETAERRVAYAQALMMQADGIVTGDARAAFAKASAEDPTAPQPRFFLGLAAAQDGDKDGARAIWRALLEGAPDNAPWVAVVRNKLASLDGPASAGPASSQGAAIAGLPAAEQQQAIRGMVDGLATRLGQNGNDRDGWLRLIRSYMVLGERIKAIEAVAHARTGLAADRDGTSQVEGLARELGLDR